MLVMPFAHDQFENATRMVRLGVARKVSREKMTPPRMARELETLLNDPRAGRIARAAALQVRAEDGMSVAVDALEGLLAPR
jgi:rhamnosyltransferase subunit B